MLDKKKIFQEIKSWTLTIVLAFILAMVFHSQLYAHVRVNQSSMETTLMPGEHLLVDKFSYRWSKPKHGDIIIFLPHDKRGSIIDESIRMLNSIKNSIFQTPGEESYVKRIIGLPGDIIDIRDGIVYRNDEALEEPYTHSETLTRTVSFPLTVQEGTIFVLGDNRVYSMDGRDFGLIKQEQVEGKVIVRIYPFSKMGFISSK